MNPLRLETPEEEKIFQQGESKGLICNKTCYIMYLCVVFKYTRSDWNTLWGNIMVFTVNKTRRVELSTASLLRVAPTAEERTLVHSLFLNTLDVKYDLYTHTHTQWDSQYVYMATIIHY